MSILVYKLVCYCSPYVTLAFYTVRQRQPMCYVGTIKLELYLYKFSLNSLRKTYFYVDIKRPYAIS
jgi:hypothetical protein